MLLLGVTVLAYLSQRYYPVHAEWDGSGKHFLRNKADLFMLIAIIWMVFFSALRTSYNDTGTYITHFLNSESLQEYFARDGLWDLTGNPLHELYRDFIRSFTTNYHIYFFFPALLNTLAVVKLCKRYSASFTFSMYLFIAAGTYVTFIAALKQSMAVPVLVLAIPYAIDKKYVRFYLLVFLAVLFHTHAFLFALLPLLFFKPWGKMTWFFGALAVFAMVTYDSTLGTFMESAQSIGVNVAEVEVFDGHSINAIRVGVYAVVPALALIFRRRLFDDSSRSERLFVNMSIMAFFILSIGLVEGANLYARMASYFEIGTLISLPWIISKVFVSKSRKVILALAMSLFFGFFLYEFGVAKVFNSDYRAISIWKLFTA